MASTSADLIEIVRFLNGIFSKNFTQVIADSTRAFGVGPPCLSTRDVSREPELTPMRIGIFFRLAALAIFVRRSLSLMLPGLIRILSAPFSIERRARFGSKWMSATIGTWVRRLICLRARAAFLVGTATRTKSAPSFSRARICLMVCATFSVLVSHIDWIVIFLCLLM